MSAPNFYTKNADGIYAIMDANEWTAYNLRRNATWDDWNEEKGWDKTNDAERICSRRVYKFLSGIFVDLEVRIYMRPGYYEWAVLDYDIFYSYYNNTLTECRGDIDEFADFHTAYWERRSGHDLLSREFIKRVCATALARKQALLYGLRDEKGTLMAARFVVYDSHCAYSLLSALHADALRNSMTLLVWTMITDLHDRTKAFDFEGGMDPGIGHFYHSFGTTKTEIPCIYRSRIPFGKKLLHL